LRGSNGQCIRHDIQFLLHANQSVAVDTINTANTSLRPHRIAPGTNGAILAARSAIRAMRCGRVRGLENIPVRRLGNAQRELAAWKFEVPIEWRI
jgi:hypothetical protein